jgi:hypothetical protein
MPAFEAAGRFDPAPAPAPTWTPRQPPPPPPVPAPQPSQQALARQVAARMQVLALQRPTPASRAPPPQASGSEL